MAVKRLETIHRNLADKITKALTHRERRQHLREALFRTLEKRKATIQETFTDFEHFRNEVRETKARAIEKLDELLYMFVSKCEKRGAKVHIAKNAEEACEIVYRIASEKGAKLLTKSKSMTTEEIGLNDYLEKRGLRVVDTDLGELIVQLAGEKPFHLVYPAVHKTRQEVAELFSKVAGRPVGDGIPELMNFAREYLREIFLSAEIGITGVNIAIAETGTVVIETNEGNDRLGNIPPPVYIAVMGVEKLVETVDDALRLIVAHPVSSTGQTLTTYVSLISGRNPLGGRDEGREFHIVVIDNGRSEMKKDPVFREALYCIRCGACMNICPTYSTVGGHIFGHKYTGPIGIPWTAFVHGLEKAAEFAPLCISCGLCKEICPTIIDIPFLIAQTKHLYIKKAGQLFVNRVVETYETAYRLGAIFPSVFNAVVGSRVARWFMQSFLGIDSRRRLPKVADKTLDKMLGDRAKKTNGEVVFFADFFFRYVRPDLGLKAVQAIEDAGFTVVFPPQRSSGYPYFAYGDLDKARKMAEYNVAVLAKSLDGNAVVVSLEPTATYSIKYLYPKLLAGNRDAERVAAATVSFTEFMEKLVADGKVKMRAKFDGKAAIHVPCHERALDSCRAVRFLMASADVEAIFVETGTCCGMAGTFGMKKGVMGYELANVVGEDLFDLMKKSGCRYVVSTSSVCRIHIEDGTGLPVVHPLEALEFIGQRKL